MEEEILLGQAGSAQAFELEDTSMYQTDTRDQAADRDAEAYEGFKHFKTSQKIEADVALFIENPRLVKMRQGVGDLWVLCVVRCGDVQPNQSLESLPVSSFSQHAGGTVYSSKRLADIAGKRDGSEDRALLLHLQRS